MSLQNAPNSQLHFVGQRLDGTHLVDGKPSVWRPVVVRQISQDGRQLLIHYEGLDVQWDEWVDKYRSVAPLGRHTGRNVQTQVQPGYSSIIPQKPITSEQFASNRQIASISEVRNIAHGDAQYQEIRNAQPVSFSAMEIEQSVDEGGRNKRRSRTSRREQRRKHRRRREHLQEHDNDIDLSSDNEEDIIYELPPLHRPIFFFIMLLFSVTSVIVALHMNNMKFASLDENPFYGAPLVAQAKAGAACGKWLVNLGKEGNLLHKWRLLISPFMSGGIFHAAWNVIFGLKVMAQLETRYGTIRVGAIYVFSSIFGTWLTLYFVPDVAITGGTCGLFGCLGGCMASLIVNSNRYKNPHKETLVLGLWGVGGMVVGFAPLADNLGNVTATFFGMFFGLVVFKQVQALNLNEKGHSSTCLRLIAFIVVLLLFGSITILMFNSEDAHLCKPCSDVSCLEIAWKCPPKPPSKDGF